MRPFSAVPYSSNARASSLLDVDWVVGCVAPLWPQSCVLWLDMACTMAASAGDTKVRTLMMPQPFSQLFSVWVFSTINLIKRTRANCHWAVTIKVSRGWLLPLPSRHPHAIHSPDSVQTHSTRCQGARGRLLPRPTSQSGHSSLIAFHWINADSLNPCY